MPELPEVEHIVRALKRAVTGRRIMAIDLNLKKLAGGSPSTFTRKLRGAQIESIGRRGKYILINLDSGNVLTVHLRMTGKFVCVSLDASLPPYAQAIFYLDDDRRLVFCDMRQFGRMKIVAASRLHKSKELAALAPEPLSDEFTPDHFRATLSRSRRTLKQLLLDQTKVLGLGNIYAAEALFLARISPFTAADKLSKQRAVRLHSAIRGIIQEAIDCGSTLRVDLEDGDGSYFGTLERFWRVYEREGEPCVNCSAKIRRVVHGGRSTYFCPRCQRQ
jgi:formamidopyrimidine-DNA glycosylase